MGVDDILNHSCSSLFLHNYLKRKNDEVSFVDTISSLLNVNVAGKTDKKTIVSYYDLGVERYVPILLSLWRTLEVGVASPCCSTPSNCSCEPTLSRGMVNALEMMSCSSSGGLAGSRR